MDSSGAKLSYKQFLNLNYWKEIWGKLKNDKNKLALLAALLIVVLSLGVYYYFSNTQEAPIKGGNFTEGIIGQPRFIHPFYSDNDIDRDLVELLYAGLFTYNTRGEIIKELVESYQISEDGKIYEFQLKDNVFWHDGTQITVDDVIFTIKAIQNPNYKTPLIIPWFDIEAEKISENSFSLTLKSPYASFLENCVLKIIPRHIWKDVSPDKLPLSLTNFPSELLIGSGPFKFKNLKFKEGNNAKLEYITLEANLNYALNAPYLDQVILKFFENQKDLIWALNRKEVDGFTALAPLDKGSLLDKTLSYSALYLPRYFALFLNLEKEILHNKETRLALAYGINKEGLLEEVFRGEAQNISSPFPLNSFWEDKELSYDLEKTENYLEEAGFYLKEDGKREKVLESEIALNFSKQLKLGSRGEEVENLQKCLYLLFEELYPEKEITGYFGNDTKEAIIKFQKTFVEGPADGLVGKNTIAALNEFCSFPEKVLDLSFSITTLDDPVLEKTANFLKDQGEKFGANIYVEKYSLPELTRIIQERSYDALLFGQSLGLIPDPFPFWHSTQKQNPGLNLSNYKNKEADILLEEIRQSLDQDERKEKLEKLRNIILEETPAIFLYNPNYYYILSNKIKGVPEEIQIASPSKRFTGIENWYIRTKRVWK